MEIEKIITIPKQCFKDSLEMSSSSFLKNLEWRRAVKKFVPGPPIDTTPIEKAIVATPTSFGLQPYKVIAIRDPVLKEKLRAVSYGQTQVTDCDTLFVFCVRTDVEERAEKYLAASGAESMRPILMDFLKKKNYDGIKTQTVWSTHQAYLALGFALAAAAEAEIPSCPMEGFDAKHVWCILDLDETNLWPVAYLAVGHTVPGDDGTYPRFRFPAENLIERR
jgi:nitroreductase/dihydropteridine reductase